MKPYYEHAGITIYHGDCREIIPQLPLVPCVIADPPYGETAFDWDNLVEDWLRPTVEVLKPGTLWCFGSLRYFLATAAQFGVWFKLAQDVIWEKHNGSGFSADRFRRVHEHAVQFYPRTTKWEDCVKNPLKGHPSDHKQVIRHSPPKHAGHVGASKYQTTRGEFCLQRSVIYCRSTHRKAVHPTQKPVSVVEMLVKYSSNPGDTIIEPFMGSGTGLIAAKNTGRFAIGIDNQEWCCEIAAKRLSQEVFQF